MYYIISTCFYKFLSELCTTFAAFWYFKKKDYTETTNRELEPRGPFSYLDAPCYILDAPCFRTLENKGRRSRTRSTEWLPNSPKRFAWSKKVLLLSFLLKSRMHKAAMFVANDRLRVQTIHDYSVYKGCMDEKISHKHPPAPSLQGRVLHVYTSRKTWDDNALWSSWTRCYINN